MKERKLVFCLACLLLAFTAFAHAAPTPMPPQVYLDAPASGSSLTTATNLSCKLWRVGALGTLSNLTLWTNATGAWLNYGTAVATPSNNTVYSWLWSTSGFFKWNCRGCTLTQCNTTGSPSNWTFLMTLDTTPPTMNISSPTNGFTYDNGKVWFNLTADPDTQWCGVSIDGGPNASLSHAPLSNAFSSIAKAYSNGSGFDGFVYSNAGLYTRDSTKPILVGDNTSGGCATGGGCETNRGWITFDISQVPNGSTIVEANLTMWVKTANYAGYETFFCIQNMTRAPITPGLTDNNATNAQLYNSIGNNATYYCRPDTLAGATAYNITLPANLTSDLTAWVGKNNNWTIGLKDNMQLDTGDSSYYQLESGDNTSTTTAPGQGFGSPKHYNPELTLKYVSSHWTYFNPSVPPGTHEITFYCNDSSGNVNSNTINQTEYATVQQDGYVYPVDLIGEPPCDGARDSTNTTFLVGQYQATPGPCGGTFYDRGYTQFNTSKVSLNKTITGVSLNYYVEWGENGFSFKFHNISLMPLLADNSANNLLIAGFIAGNASWAEKTADNNATAETWVLPVPAKNDFNKSLYTGSNLFSIGWKATSEVATHYIRVASNEYATPALRPLLTVKWINPITIHVPATPTPKPPIDLIATTPESQPSPTGGGGKAWILPILLVGVLELYFAKTQFED